MKKETFSERVKKEITNHSFQEHCMKALLSGFINNKLTVVLKHNELVWRLNSQFPFIIDFIEMIFKNLYTVKVKKHISATATNINGLTNYIEIIGNFDLIKNDLSLNDQWDRQELCEKECCKRAYIAGAFLACGSVNSPDAKSYHLEIRSNNYKYLVFIQALLTQFNIFAVLTKHNTKQFFLYVKKVDQISDFLKLVGATQCMFDLEDFKIARDNIMQNNRLNNLDISNINKTAVSGAKQIKQIKSLKLNPIYFKQSPKFKAFCELRLSHPSSSLAELVKLMKTKYSISITKAGLNHLVRKLNNLTN